MAIERTAEILNFNGYDFALYLGKGRDGNRVVVVGMRRVGQPRYRPIIEADIDVTNYWADTASGFDDPRGDLPPPVHTP